ncbi:ABC transporter substrate-binding protein [Streptomyces sp. NEAU-YJ-81]|uniref:ABC transporter substrate-binding protein n=1 Tax=Streptomyces sp. NEAU-YJ-81 TaxID=2820288 RepID=UPI001ABD295E|nr:sugar ABC transporter substrate-binding protein [Streptomyces sp. NEAU-YJ-81]MBO3681360.1 sugar ABC transporter substrate-binding protein [Streptomyces sp. NEAU-YJ-81]
MPLLIGLTTTACFGPIPHGGGSGGGVTLQFVGAQPDGYFDKAIAAFEKANPGIKVKYVSNPASQLSQVLQARLGGKDSSIDAFTADEPKIPSMADRGFLLPLDDLKDEAGKQVSAEAVRATTFDNKLYALPLWTSTALLYYNKDLLKKAGIADPAKATDQRLSWEQLTADAKKAQAGGAQYGFAFEQPGRYYQLEPLIRSAGGGTGLSGAKNLTPAIQDRGWKKALTFYQGLFKKGITPKGIQYTQLPSLFANGKIAYFLANTPSIAIFQKNPKLKFGVAPSPTFAGGKPATPTDSWALAVSPYSRHQAEARKFISFLSLNEAGAALSGQDIARIPANKHAYAAWSQLIDAAGPELAGTSKLIADELSRTAVKRPSSIGYTDFESVVNKMIDNIGNGGDVNGSLTDGQSQLVNTLGRFGT